MAVIGNILKPFYSVNSLLITHSTIYLCIIYQFSEPYETSIEWCDGLGFLIILIVIIDSTILYNLILKPLVIKLINTKVSILGIAALRFTCIEYYSMIQLRVNTKV